MATFNYVICIIMLHFVYIHCDENCEIHATIARHIENEGFHRELHSHIEVVVGQADLWEDCSVVLEELLPPALYVNPDQLNELQRLGQLGCWHTGGHWDVEQPEQVAESGWVALSTKLRRAHNLLSTRLSLPLHARYRPPSPGGGPSYGATPGTPQLLLRCNSRGPTGCLRDAVSWPCDLCWPTAGNCTWRRLPYRTNSGGVSVRVPVGDSELSPLVTTVTLLATWAAAAYILTAIATAASRRVA